MLKVFSPGKHRLLKSPHRFVIILIGFVIEKISILFSYCIREYKKTKFRAIGKNVYFGHSCIFSYNNISIGDDTYIGSKCVIQSAHGLIDIGNHVMFGAGVHIHGGNHIYNVVGQYMKSIGKQPGSDGTISIKDDVWIGSNAIIVGGVRYIGEGAIVGAGSVVTKNVEPYSIVVGNPARVIKMRFNPEDLEEHKRLIKEKE